MRRNKIFIDVVANSRRGLLKSSFIGLSGSSRFPSNWFVMQELVNSSSISRSCLLTHALKECPNIGDSLVYSGLSMEFFTPDVKWSSILRFILWRRHIPFSRNGREYLSFYFDLFKLQLNQVLNIFFPWYEPSLQSRYYVLQLQRIKSKSIQFSWVKLHFLLLGYFSSLSSNKRVAPLKYFNLYRYSFILRGRYCDMIACRFHRIRYVNGNTLNYKSSNKLGLYYSSYSDTFVTKWGTMSIYYTISIPNLH